MHHNLKEGKQLGMETILAWEWNDGSMVFHNKRSNCPTIVQQIHKVYIFIDVYSMHAHHLHDNYVTHSVEWTYCTVYNVFYSFYINMWNAKLQFSLSKTEEEKH